MVRKFSRTVYLDPGSALPSLKLHAVRTRTFVQCLVLTEVLPGLHSQFAGPSDVFSTWRILLVRPTTVHYYLRYDPSLLLQLYSCSTGTLSTSATASACQFPSEAPHRTLAGASIQTHGRTAINSRCSMAGRGAAIPTGGGGDYAAAVWANEKVISEGNQAPDRANIDKRSVVKFGGCASQVD
jgi:hypothetical protein